MIATIRLTEAELSHLSSVLRIAEHSGIYYGNRAQYWDRHKRIVDKVEHAVDSKQGDK